jgi:hypothetical protein
MDPDYPTVFGGNVKIERGAAPQYGDGHLLVEGAQTVNGALEVFGEVALGAKDMSTRVRGDLVLEGRLVVPEGGAPAVDVPGHFRGSVTLPGDGSPALLPAGDLTFGSIHVLVQPADGDGPCAAFSACSTSDDSPGIVQRGLMAPWGPEKVGLGLVWPAGEQPRLFFDNLPADGADEEFDYVITTAA